LKALIAQNANKFGQYGPGDVGIAARFRENKALSDAKVKEMINLLEDPEHEKLGKEQKQ